MGEMAQQHRRLPPSVKHSMPLVTQVEEEGKPGPRKRLQQSASKRGVHSEPIQLNGQVDTDDDDDQEEERNLSKLKRAKLERIVARVIEQQARRRHGKRSVVVIDWDCADSDELLSDDAEGGKGEDEKDEETVARTRVAARSRKGPVSKTPNQAASISVTAPSATSTTLRQQKLASAARHVAAREPSTRKRNATSASLAPELGDSLLLEEDQPVLLRRPTTGRRVPTCSIPCLSAEPEDDSVFDQAVDVSRKPPGRGPASKATRRNRKASTYAPGTAPAPHFPALSVSPSTATVQVPRSFTSARQGLLDNVEASEAPLPQPVTSRRRSRAASAASKPPASGFSSDDPMAVFFGASFPSPSKFEEMVMAAGGLPGTRGAGRGQPRQPALVLPDSISRRR
ncbi:putative dynein heavy chain [Trypanosoma rangeli]|uniref:Putative dynein heavy chain n=1 Tax=Trypanosoma rangeli TaxID=5698 RepID=A0A422NTE7_TRYRA|nr:putative dynein heavy chain [Trypanosoma rangeli]RNF08733.1 putative dynein heavy chain [Trypanosoma rangeli]|eukprot:RNF08733.1 putative dynein heavy chain [Trypanosoma rangeli]